jgi:hypothetical protein
LKALSATPFARKTVPCSTFWRSGLVIVTLLLAGQIIYFEGMALSRNTAFRSNLEKLCVQLNCRLPVYKNADEFAVLQSSYSTLTNRSQLFKATLTNRAAFAQPYPNLELTLLDYAGIPFSRRTFKPQHYLTQALPATLLMLPNSSTAIALNIAMLKTNIGGYTFKLIY